MTGVAHRPFIDGSRGPQLGGLGAVACRDCGWAQAVNEDLHEGYEDRLMAWHAAHPDQGFDHLTDRDPGMRLEVPGYVRGANNGFGCLAMEPCAARKSRPQDLRHEELGVESCRPRTSIPSPADAGNS